MLPTLVDLDTLQDRRVIFRDHNIREMYTYILPNINSTQGETSTEDYGDGEPPTNSSNQSDVLSMTHDYSNSVDGNLLLNIFDDNYADLVKQEPDPSGE